MFRIGDILTLKKDHDNCCDDEAIAAYSKHKSKCGYVANSVGSVYKKKVSKMNQVQKEAIYITLLTSILTHLENATTIVFDRFGKPDFEKNIMSLANTIPNIKSIYPEDSQKQHGLQFADNICSVIRRHKSEDDEFHYYDVIEKFVKEF